MNKITLAAHKIHEIGTRAEQQDRLNYVEFESIRRFVVIDGMGGTQSGREAASRLQKWLSEEGSLEEIVVRAHENFQQWLTSKFSAVEEKDLPGAVATILEFNVRTNMAKVFHLGDTRLYVRNKTDEDSGGFKQITEDHIDGEGKVLQDFGLPTIQPTWYEFTFTGNEDILICTDGLYEVLTGDPVYEIGLYFELPDVQSIAETFIKEKQSYFEDNASGFCIQLQTYEPSVEVKSNGSIVLNRSVIIALCVGMALGGTLFKCNEDLTTPSSQNDGVHLPAR